MQGDMDIKTFNDTSFINVLLYFYMQIYAIICGSCLSICVKSIFLFNFILEKACFIFFENDNF